MSGSPIASWSFHSRAEIRNSSMDVVRHLGCDDQDKITAIGDPGSGDGETDANSTVIEEEEMWQEIDVKIMNCMKKADPVDIVNWSYYVSTDRKLFRIVAIQFTLTLRDVLFLVTFNNVKLSFSS